MLFPMNMIIALALIGILTGIVGGLTQKQFTLWPFIGVVWALTSLILASVIKRIQNKEEDKKEVSGVVINVKRGKSVTELDSLYELLKEKKTLKISVISKLFKISNEKALEWAKILENHDLGEIEYPAFSEPELVSK
mgnify:CR=1 FL=1